MAVVLFLVFVFLFAVYIAFEAMKFGMCQRKWFVVGMCLGPLAWPMFNVKRQMKLRLAQKHQQTVKL